MYKLAVENNDILESLNSFFKSLLREGIVDFLLVPQETKTKEFTVPTLVDRPESLESALALAPFLLLNSATLLSQVTIDNPKDKIGAVMRSCEIRAAVELSKLKQINWENVVIIGVDCLGTYEPRDYKKISKDFKASKAFTREFISTAQSGRANPAKGSALRLACQGCVHPAAENFDLTLNFVGCDINKEIFVQASERIDKEKIKKLALTPVENNSCWAKAVEDLRNERLNFSHQFIADTLGQLKDIKDFLKALEGCRRCYNCRRACPICYCRECIFDSLVFEHESDQYMRWAKKRGKIRMPSDTLLFHLTRMNHMVISCVACGQCSSACPNDIPVANFFKSVGAKVQEIFNYEPGKKLDEEIPQSTFKEDEFSQVGK